MEVIEAFKNNIGILMMAIIGGAGVISMGFAAWFFLMGQGEPQQMAKARNCLLGGIVGLILGGFAFAIPEILSETVVQPSGGQGFAIESAGSCDDIFRRELVLQPNANTGSRMNQVIRVIQTREEDCLEDDWDPRVMGEDDEAVAATGTTWAGTSHRSRCFRDAAGAVQVPGEDEWLVDGVIVPGRLLVNEVASGSGTPTVRVPSRDSVRDVNDNILVYFGATDDSKPTDLAECWLYLNRDQLWLAVN